MSVGWNLNDSITFLLPKTSFIFSAKWLHSTKMYRTVRIDWQHCQNTLTVLTLRWRIFAQDIWMGQMFLRIKNVLPCQNAPSSTLYRFGFQILLAFGGTFFLQDQRWWGETICAAAAARWKCFLGPSTLTTTPEINKNKFRLDFLNRLNLLFNLTLFLSYTLSLLSHPLSFTLSLSSPSYLSSLSLTHTLSLY